MLALRERFGAREDETLVTWLERLTTSANESADMHAVKLYMLQRVLSRMDDLDRPRGGKRPAWGWLDAKMLVQSLINELEDAQAEKKKETS